MSEGELLIGDGVTRGIVRIGDTVRRPLRPFSLTVQAYLAPRPRTWPPSDVKPRSAAERYLRMLTARATTRATATIETAAWAAMPIFAHRDSGIVSVGLNAVALVNDRYR